MFVCLIGLIDQTFYLTFFIIQQTDSGGLDGKTYTDHSCLMGNPWWEDDRGRMCFNPVKNYQVMMSGNR